MEDRTDTGRRPHLGRRIGLLAFGLVVVALSVVVLKATSLAGLPDIGDPFDVAAFGTIEIPDDQNAWTFYRRANAVLTPEPQSAANTSMNQGQDPVALRWADENRASLDLWIEGSKRERAVYVQPKDMAIETQLPDVQNLRSLARLGLWEGARREANGDMAGAWEVYRAGLRSSRHCGSGGVMIERLVGVAIYWMYAARISNWASDPKVDAATLRVALKDVYEADAMKAPTSEIWKAEYLVLMKALRNNPDAYLDPALSPSFKPSDSSVTDDLFQAGTRAMHRISRVFMREPERSRRILRLAFANFLDTSQFPREERNQRVVARGTLAYYQPAEGSDPARHPISVQELHRWSETSPFVKLFLPSMEPMLRAIDREDAVHASLVVHLAEEIAVRETGKFPDSPESLVGPYLKEMPQGYVPVVGPPDGLAPKRSK